jgi:hypothetical protein
MPPLCGAGARTSPSSSTARHRYIRFPSIQLTISSRCHHGDGDPSPHPIATGPDRMVMISAGRVTNGTAKGYKALRLQLFPILGTSAHAVIVGAPP